MYSANKNIKMVILQEQNIKGAMYVNNVSYNKLNNLDEEFEKYCKKIQSML